jgi:hypothetical protein
MLYARLSNQIILGQTKLIPYLFDVFTNRCHSFNTLLALFVIYLLQYYGSKNCKYSQYFSGEAKPKISFPFFCRLPPHPPPKIRKKEGKFLGFACASPRARQRRNQSVRFSPEPSRASRVPH